MLWYWHCPHSMWSRRVSMKRYDWSCYAEKKIYIRLGHREFREVLPCGFWDMRADIHRDTLIAIHRTLCGGDVKRCHTLSEAHTRAAHHLSKALCDYVVTAQKPWQFSAETRSSTGRATDEEAATVMSITKYTEIHPAVLANYSHCNHNGRRAAGPIPDLSRCKYSRVQGSQGSWRDEGK